jgi:hypothetical protein
MPTSHKNGVGIISPNRERADRVLGRVVVDRHSPVVEECRQRGPIAQRIVDGPGRGICLDQPLALRREPGVQRIGHWL